MADVKCPYCFEVLGDYSEYEGASGHSEEWWASKALDEMHS